jgi:TRAP-type C4-dicarboxylate transport system permease small subunit
METVRKISGKVSDLSARLIHWTLVVMVAVMTVLVIIQVLLRYIFFYSLSWSEEVARYLMIWVSFLAAALAVQKGLHIGMESLIIRLSPAMRRKVNIMTKSAVLIFLLYLTIGGFKIAWLVREQSSPALFLSMSYAYAAGGVGGLFMAIQMFHSLIEEWTGPALPGRV